MLVRILEGLCILFFFVVLCVLSLLIIGVLMGVIVVWCRGWVDMMLNFIVNMILVFFGLVFIFFFVVLVFGFFIMLYLVIFLVLVVEYFRLVCVIILLVVIGFVLENFVLMGFLKCYLFNKYIWFVIW